MACDDADSLVLLPVCDHMRRMAKPLILEATPETADLIIESAARGANENAAIGGLVRLAFLGKQVLDAMRCDKTEMEAIRNA